MTNTVSTLNGLFYERYAKRVAEAMPDQVEIQNDVPFVDAGEQIGNAWHQPIVLSYESGLTYAAADSGAFAINTPVAAVMKDAQVTGTQILLEARLSYEAAARAADSKRAFEKAMDRVVRNMVNSIGRRVEVGLLRGGSTTNSGIGRVSAVAGGGTSITITLASWAAGLWAGNENAVLDVYDNDGAGGTPGTQRNTTTAISVTSVTMSTRTIVVTGNAGELATIAADDYIYFRGSLGAEPLGLINIASNTGTMFNIAGGTYSFWQGNSYAVGGALSMQKVFNALDAAVDRGLDEDVCLYVNPGGWTDLAQEQAALRMYDSSYGQGSEGGSGFKRLKFYYQSGGVEIVAHKHMPEGLAVAYPKKRFKRLGSTDITFDLPGSNGKEFFYHLPSNAGVGIRCYTQQAIYGETPARCVLLTGIVNNT